MITMEQTREKPNRILAIDILRGLTIAGMILVNNPGDGSHVFAPLEHAEWIGLTPTDLVFPFFMFIMGMTTYISMSKYHFEATSATYRKILRRSLGIILVGYFIGIFAHFCYTLTSHDMYPDFGTRFVAAINFLPSMRITGVLVRLGVCYGIVALLSVKVSHKRFPYIIAALFIVYFIILELGNGYEHGESNILSVVDLSIFGMAHIWNDNFIDPEGLLSTIPSVAHVMIGFVIGQMMLSGHKSGEKRSAADLTTVTFRLLLIGAVLVISGFLLSYACPISKKIWSPTFSLVSCGFASLVLALLIYVVDIKGVKRWALFFRTFGVNPLFLYVMADVFAILLGAIPCGEASLHYAIFSGLWEPLFGPYGGSLAFALVFVLLNYFVVALPLYRHNIYIKL